MPGNNNPSADHTINSKLVDKIINLSEEQQLILLKQLIKGKLTATLHELISQMSEHEKLTLLEQLQEVPVKPVSLEETEIALRSYARKSCMLKIDYVVEGRNFEGFMLDISPAGAFIESGEAFNAGQQIKLTFSVPNNPRQMTINGEILWNGKSGIGLQFKELSREQIDIIAAFMVGQ